MITLRTFGGFPGDSDGKESACNAGDLRLILVLERSPGEGNGYPLHYSCLEDAMDRGIWRATVPGPTELDTTEQTHLGHLFCRHQPSPTQLNYRLHPQFVGPAASASPVMVTEVEALSLPAGKIQSGPWVSRYLACGVRGCKGLQSHSLPQIPPGMPGTSAGLWPWLHMCPFLCWDSSPTQWSP